MANGAKLLVQVLKDLSADTIFCVPGESYLAVLDALYDTPQIRVVNARQEGGAAMMAEAYGKLTGKPGICMVTRGPGATNAAAGIHIAKQDSTPLVLFVGDVSRSMLEREAFQEIDYKTMFGPLTKWVARIDRADRVPEFVARAFAVSQSGRPGPVVLTLPEDMLIDEVSDSVPIPRVVNVPLPYPDPHVRGEVLEALSSSRAPIVIIGGTQWSDSACAALAEFSAENRLPVVASFRRQDRLDNRHPCYVGDLGLGMSSSLGKNVADADLLLIIGARMGEVPTAGYTLLRSPQPFQKVIHMHADLAELGRVYQADITVNTTPSVAIEFLRQIRLPNLAARDTWLSKLQSDYKSSIETKALPGNVQFAKIVKWLDANVPEDTIVTNGAGNYTVFIHRYFRYKRLGTQLAPISGSMGYGIPAAVAAKILYPERMVICFSGDGCFQMTMQEIGVAAEQGAAVIFIVVNNGYYGTIRMHQERHYPGRVIATDIHNPDFVGIARAYGMYGERVEETDQFESSFQRAVASKGPALLEVVIHPDALSANASLSSIRAKALAQQ